MQLQSPHPTLRSLGTALYDDALSGLVSIQRARSTDSRAALVFQKAEWEMRTLQTLEEEQGVSFLQLKTNLDAARASNLSAAAVEVAANLAEAFEAAYERACTNSPRGRGLRKAIEAEDARIAALLP